MIGWNAVLIWFSASILSQAAFIGTHGIPYDANMLLDALGPWSWVLITIELGIWIALGVIVTQKFVYINKKQPQIG